MTENIDPNDIEDCQKQVFDLEAEVRELRAALGRAANDLMLSEESFVTMRAKRDEVLSELRTTRAALERARAALERERMELVSASVSVSRARELTLAQEIRANNLSAALERARAVERQLRIASDDPRASYETSRAYERAANDLEAALGVAPVSAQTCQECGHLESEHRSVAGGLGFACRHAGCDCIKQAAAPGGAA